MVTVSGPMKLAIGQGASPLQTPRAIGPSKEAARMSTSESDSAAEQQDAGAEPAETAAGEEKIGPDPFGACAPGALQARMRRFAGKLPRRARGGLLASLLFRLSGGKTRRPYDVVVFGDRKVRLHPYDNLCEKRLYAGEQFWDVDERSSLKAQIEVGAAADPNRPFIFIDAGANVGLYSLFVDAATREAGIPSKIIAVEPEPTVRERLTTNIALSEASITVIDQALGAEAGTVDLTVNTKNRGEGRIAGNTDEEPAGKTINVPVRTLHDLVTSLNLSRVDVLKIDIEGYEWPVLNAYFEAAPKALFPRTILLETVHGAKGEASALDLCVEHGYQIARQTRLNSILRRPPGGADDKGA